MSQEIPKACDSSVLSLYQTLQQSMIYSQSDKSGPFLNKEWLLLPSNCGSLRCVVHMDSESGEYVSCANEVRYFWLAMSIGSLHLATQEHKWQSGPNHPSGPSPVQNPVFIGLCKSRKKWILESTWTTHLEESQLLSHK